ncbi:MAG TPA: NAD(+)/NADH kinase [Chloroflexi bacterium]|nr:NAD(+)/NADH kinase [Chloroflexota bacterium]
METPRRIAILAHPQVATAPAEAQRIAEYLAPKAERVSYGLLYDAKLRARVDGGEFDVVIALGGDGTMLRAGHLCAPSNTPILGVNLGKFGFLFEIGLEDLPRRLNDLMRGAYWLEVRMMLNCTHWREGKKLGEWDALNEVVVSRGAIVRPVHLITEVDGRYLTTYVADGLVAATPTGSTAYALAAGGPILPPELRNILLVPVAPHLSIDRPIVLAEGASVRITVRTDHQAVASVDGQPPISLQTGDQIAAQAGSHNVSFVRFGDPDYFYRNLTPHMNRNPVTAARSQVSGGSGQQSMVS